MESKSKFQISAGWLVAFTWFGGHCGSGFASGRQIVQYTTRHGIAGIWIPILTWTLLAWFTYWATEYGRLIRARNYRDFVKHFYGPIAPVFNILFDIMTFVGTFIILSAMYSASGQLGVDALGWNYTVSSIVVAVICVIGTVFFYDIFSKFSSFLTIPMIVLLLLVQCVVLYYNWDNLMLVFQTSGLAEGSSIPAMIGDSLTYAGVQCGFYATAIALTYTFTRGKKDTKDAVIGGSILNWIMHTFNVLMVYSGYPRVNNIPLVTRSLILETNIIWLLRIYELVFLLAIVTTAVGSIYGFLVRFGFLGDRIVTNKTARYCIWAMIMSFGAIGLATFGLITVINKGYGFLGNVRTPMTIYPIAIFGLWRFNQLRKKMRAEGTIDEKDNFVLQPAEAAVAETTEA